MLLGNWFTFSIDGPALSCVAACLQFSATKPVNSTGAGPDQAENFVEASQIEISALLHPYFEQVACAGQQDSQTSVPTAAAG